MAAEWERMEGALVLAAVLASGLAAFVRNVLPRSDAHGSAGWTKPPGELLARRGAKVPPLGFLLSRQGGVARSVVLPPILAARHGVVLGGSGTGKTRGYFLPNAALRRESSLVCSDPKGELWRHTSGLHKEAWRFAPAEPDSSLSFNWIPMCSDPRVAEIAARAVVESGQTSGTEQAWLDLEAAFLAAVFSHASTLPEPTPLAAYRFFTERTLEEVVRALLDSPSASAREQARMLRGTSDRMKGAFVPVVAARMVFMRDPRVRRFTSASLEAPDLSALRKRPIAAYWCLHEGDVVRLRPLTSLFFTLLLDRATRGDEGEAPAVPLTMLLDEFANIGAIPSFEVLSSVARGRGVSLWLGLQALSQLEDRYGASKAKTILANMATKVALSGLDLDSSEWVSRTLGESTRATSRESWHRRGFAPLPSSVSTAEGEHVRRLLTADEVRRLGEDEAIVVVANRRPMRLRRDFYDEPPRTAPAPILGPALGGDESEAKG